MGATDGKDRARLTIYYMDSFKTWLEDINQAGIMGASYATPAIVGGGGAGSGFDQYGQRWTLPRKRKKKPIPLGDMDGNPPKPIQVFQPSKELMINPT